MGFLLSVWFASSIASTLINKMLMVHFPYPVTISFVHMLSSVLVDLCIVVSRGLSLRPLRPDIFWQCLPVAATINFGQHSPQHTRRLHRTTHHGAHSTPHFAPSCDTHLLSPSNRFVDSLTRVVLAVCSAAQARL